MSIKLEIGKKYVCRNGAVVGPLEKNPDGGSFYPFWCSVDPKTMSGLHAASWTENGVWGSNDEDEINIVAEYHEYVWKWMDPDKPGVWMFGGCARNAPDRGKSNIVYDASTWPEGWWCFLMDIPSIQMPPKQRVTKRLWLRKIESCVVIYNAAGARIPCSEPYEERWEPNGITPEDGRWISTNVTKEVEQ